MMIATWRADLDPNTLTRCMLGGLPMRLSIEAPAFECDPIMVNVAPMSSFVQFRNTQDLTGIAAMRAAICQRATRPAKVRHGHSPMLRHT
jgi:hypothetical protein